MAYIGKQPVIGNFVKLDAISVVNGQAAYTMNNGGSAFTNYDNVNQFLVSLNGILQAPTDSFTVSGSTLTFASNLATGDVIDFVIVLGNTLDIGTPSDNTVSTAKIVDGAVTAAKLASGVGGKVLQVVSVAKTDTFSTTSNSFVDVTGLTLNITPSSTSSKILVLCDVKLGVDAGVSSVKSRIEQTISASDTYPYIGDAENSNTRSSFGTYVNEASFIAQDASTVLLSPSTTSQITYTYQMVEQAGGTVYVNRPESTDTGADAPRTASSLTVMEIGA
jgi:hypothetical protein